ncbi:hypothetical protein F1D05_24315 [Kribbella qitaiheensis]|uniref:Uncharacterized protein n=1 Tax=Kribbella qitaiheensis TaxID=1544730 RepID=A0A7G6X2J8_9ACTN|nr:hypothetical protein [Kribbella qitaiheensis]QNE20463.1 hypothetical protein F1D05_24315 [Kribbella qitaiheensis]
MSAPAQIRAWERAALLCYPRGWRAERGDEVLAVMLDSAEAEGRDQIDPRDLLNLAAHGLQTRLARLNRVMPSRVRDRAALIAAAIGAAFCVSLLLFAEGAIGVPMPAAGHDFTLSAPIYLAWPFAVVLAVLGHTRIARLLLVLTALGAAAVPSLATATHHAHGPRWLMSFLALLCLLAVSGNLGQDRTAQRRLLWLTTAATISVAAAFALYFQTVTFSDGLYHGYERYNCSYFTVAAFGVAVVLLLTGHRSWSAAFALNGMVGLGLLALLPGPGGIHSTASTITPLPLLVLSTFLAGGAAVSVQQRRRTS